MKLTSALKFDIPIPFTKKLPEGGKHYHVLAWRKVLSFDTFKNGFYFGVSGQHLSDHDNEWHLGYGYHTVTVVTDPKEWEWGSDHGYYDGPHCSFAMGPVRFNWQNDWCDTCMPPDE